MKTIYTAEYLSNGKPLIRAFYTATDATQYAQGVVTNPASPVVTIWKLTPQPEAMLLAAERREWWAEKKVVVVVTPVRVKRAATLKGN